MTNSFIIFVSLCCIICSVQCLLMPIGWMRRNVTKKSGSTPIRLPKCVPSDTVRGICVACICNTDGIYICRAVKCIKPELPALPEKFECKANVTYRKDFTVCRCSVKSQWISNSCRQILRTLKSDRFPILRHSNSTLKCKPYVLYLVDCNICQCNKAGFIQASLCTSRPCNSTSKADSCRFGDVIRTKTEICVCSEVNYYVDALCIKTGPKLMQEINRANIKVVTNIKYRASGNCIPHKEYYDDCNHCICDDKKDMVCTNKDCKIQAQQRLGGNENSVDLPIVKSENEPCTPASFNKHTNQHLPEILEFQSCVPGQLYKADCNTCRCSSNSTLMCTKMACVDQVYVQTMSAHNNRSNHKHKSIQSKVIARRGQDMLHGSPEMDDSDNCIPGKFYQKVCQTCFCNHQRSLMCTGTCEDKVPLKKSAQFVKKFPFQPGDVQHFPVLYHLSDKCEPGKMYRISCNGCVCQESNNLACENKLCVSHEAMAKLEAKKLSGKKCDKNEKHGCVQCTCEKNLSKCIVQPQCEERERLSSNVQKMPLALNLKKEKCIPGMMYTVQCNRCYCQLDSTLRCTQKACLNFAQAQKLHQQRVHLEEHGL